MMNADGLGSVQDTSLAVKPTEATSVSDSSNQTKNERLFTQSELNEVAGVVRKEAAERARKEAYAELQNSNSENSLSRDEVAKMIAEENDIAARTAVANKIAYDFVSKIEAAKQKYPDIINVVGVLELPNNPQIVDYVNSLDNTADVVYELAKNGLERGSILGMLATNPRGAKEELNKLSNRIKERNKEVSQKNPSKPLSQINPSTAGIDSGDLTLADFKKQSWLRG